MKMLLTGLVLIAALAGCDSDAYGPDPEPTIRDPDSFADDCTCACFRSQAEAQAYFNARGRPGRLDNDGDGTACEALD